MRFEISLLAAAACAALATGCGGCDDDPGDGYVPLPRVEGLEPEWPYYTREGEEVVLEVTLRDEDGEPQDSAMEWFIEPASWLGPDAPTWTTAQVGPGVHQARITVHAAYAPVYVMVRVHGGTERAPQSTDTPSARVIGYGGDPIEVIGYQPRIRIVPTERRPAHALPLASYPAPSDQTLRVIGDDPMTYAIADPAVATVDDQGVVTGVAVGTTMLTVTHGAATLEVPVEVATGTLGPPAPELRLFPAEPAPSEDRRWARAAPASSESVIAVDGRGYPHLALSARRRLAGTAVIASWTGTGFGFETVSRPYETVEHKVVAAVDEADRLFAVYFDEVDDGFVVAERGVAEDPGAWTHRRLDMTPADQRALGRFAWDTLRELQLVAAAVLPRRGGGAWVAYRGIHHVAVTDGSDANCVQLLRLAEVTASGITVHDVRDDRFHADWPLDCAYDRLAREYEPLTLLDAGGPVPDVLTTFPSPAQDGLVRLRAVGGAWTSELLVPATDELLANVFGRVHDLRRVTVARATQPGQVDQVLAAYCARETLVDPGLLQIVTPGDPAARWSHPVPSTGCAKLIAFQAGPYLYTSNGEYGLRSWPFGGRHGDDLVAAFTARPEWYEPLLAGVVHGDLLFTLFGGALYTTPLPPAPTLPTDDELTGGRLGSDPETAIVTTPPVIRADGSRLLLSDTVGPTSGALMSSTGVGQPWTVTARRADNAGLAQLARLWTVPGALFALRRVAPLAAPEFARSLDGGVTWLGYGSISSPQPVRAHLVAPTGEAFVVLDAPSEDHEIFYAPAVQTSPVFTSLGGLPAALATTHRIPDFGADHAVVRRGDDVYVVTLVIEDVNGGRRILIQQFDLGGTAIGYRLIDPGSGLQELHVDRAELAGDGTLYVPVWETGHLVFERKLVAIDPATGAFAIETLAAEAFTDLRLARLADGRLAAASSELAPGNRRRVVLRTRGPGGWSAPVPIRAGGRAQLVDAIAAEPGGGLLVVIGDNHAMAGASGGDAPFDRLIVRVASP